MSEDKTKEDVKIEDVKKEEVTEVTLSPVEEDASEQGWVPKETWVEQGGDPEEWRTAKEFVARGELYKSLHSTKRDLRQTQTALTALQRHHKYVYDRAYQKALDELKLEKRQAIRAEDFEALDQVEERIETLKEERTKEEEVLQAEQAAVQAAQPAPEFIAWQERNSWYARDEELREFADAQGLMYLNKNRGANPAEVLRVVEGRVKKHFPEKFGMKKAAPNAVANVDRTGKAGPKAKDDIFLDDMEREIMKTFVQSGTMTEAEYKAELKKARG